MQELFKYESQLPVYEGVIKSPRDRMLRNPEFLSNLARFYTELNKSGDATVDFVLLQIYYGFEGTLIDYVGGEIDRDSWMVDDHFGEEPRRWVNSFKKWTDNPPKQKLQEKLLERIMALYIAMRIYQERLKLTQQ